MRERYSDKGNRATNSQTSVEAGAAPSIENEQRTRALIASVIDAASADNKNDSSEITTISQAVGKFVRFSLNEFVLPEGFKVDSLVPLSHNIQSIWALSSAKSLSYVAYDPIHKYTVVKLIDKDTQTVYFSISDSGAVVGVDVPYRNEDKNARDEGYKTLSIASHKAKELLTSVAVDYNERPPSKRQSIIDAITEFSPTKSQSDALIVAASEGVLNHVVDYMREGGDLNKLSIESYHVSPSSVAISYRQNLRPYLTSYQVKTEGAVKQVKQIAVKNSEVPCVAVNMVSKGGVDFFDSLSSYTMSRTSWDSVVGAYHKEVVTPGAAQVSSRNTGGIINVKAFMDDSNSTQSNNDLPSIDESEPVSTEEDRTLGAQSLFQIQRSSEIYMDMARALNLIADGDFQKWEKMDIPHRVEYLINQGIVSRIREMDFKNQEMERFDGIVRDNLKIEALSTILKIMESAVSAGLISPCEGVELSNQAIARFKEDNWQVYFGGIRTRFSAKLYEAQMYLSPKEQASLGISYQNKVPRDLVVGGSEMRISNSWKMWRRLK